MNTNLLILANFLLFWICHILISQFGKTFDKILFPIVYITFIYLIW